MEVEGVFVNGDDGHGGERVCEARGELDQVEMVQLEGVGLPVVVVR